MGYAQNFTCLGIVRDSCTSSSYGWVIRSLALNTIRQGSINRPSSTATDDCSCRADLARTSWTLWKHLVLSGVDASGPFSRRYSQQFPAETPGAADARDFQMGWWAYCRLIYDVSRINRTWQDIQTSVVETNKTEHSYGFKWFKLRNYFKKYYFTRRILDDLYFTFTHILKR